MSQYLDGMVLPQMGTEPGRTEVAVEKWTIGVIICDIPHASLDVVDRKSDWIQCSGTRTIDSPPPQRCDCDLL